VRKRYTVRLKHHRKVAPFAYEQDIPGFQEDDKDLQQSTISKNLLEIMLVGGNVKMMMLKN
jgi:hypothetical protein